MDPRRTWEAWLLSGFGSGFLPRAPGTWGTLAACPLFWLLWQFDAGRIWPFALTLIWLLSCACVLAFRLLPRMTEDDPGWIVIDEWLGLGVCLLPLLATGHDEWPVWLGALLLFRLFDILKPWPIRPLEHIGPAWWSIMADDMLAGLFATVSLLLLLQGGQIMTR